MSVWRTGLLAPSVPLAHYLAHNIFRVLKGKPQLQDLLLTQCTYHPHHDCVEDRSMSAGLAYQQATHLGESREVTRVPSAGCTFVTGHVVVKMIV